MSMELPSVCPLDCPDTCSLNVTVEAGRITKVRGSRVNPLTEGAICGKVSKLYPDFVHGENRLTQPLRRIGAKGEGRFEAISWAEALDLIHDRLEVEKADCGQCHKGMAGAGRSSGWD